MTIRSDLTIDWGSSPRIVTIAAPSVSITVQDLYDTLRDLASKPEAIDDDEIVDAGGKESLSEEESVALTVTLFNAKVKFEDRTLWTVCEIIGGNLVALDSALNPMNPIQPAAFVNVDRASSTSATLVQSPEIDAIKAKTDNLPSDPAEESSVQEALDILGIPASTIAGHVEAINERTDNLPDDPADQSLLEDKIDDISVSGKGAGTRFQG